MSTETKPTQWYDDPEQIALLKRTQLAKASKDEADTFINICQRTGLDPFARQIYATFRSVKRGQQYVDVLQTQCSIDGFRIVAQRSGEYQGQTPPLWCGQDGVWVDVWLRNTPPAACKIGVHRKDFKEPLYAIAVFEDYAQYVRDGNSQKLGHMWAKMPSLMIAKCCEALALRKAFPQDLSGLYTGDEMSQQDNPAKSHKPEDEDQRPPDEKPPLAPTKPLPAGSFQTVPKAEDPAPVTKTPEKPVSAPKPAASAAPEESGSQVIDLKHSRDWKSVVYSTGKGAKAKHKKFGDLQDKQPDFLDKLEAYYLRNAPNTTQDQMYAEALRWRREELDATEALPIDQLRALCAKDKIDERDILRVAQTELADGARSLEEVSTDNITYLIDNWAQAKILADDIPA